jgi:hypothetical protein
MSENPVKDPALERHGRRFGHSARWFLLIAAVIAIPGIVLVAIHTSWSVGWGLAVLALACLPGVVGLALLGSSLVARWSSRHKSFA